MFKTRSVVLICSMVLSLCIGFSAEPDMSEKKPAGKMENDIEKAVAARRGKTELSRLAAKMKPGTWARLTPKQPKDLMFVKNSRGTRFHIAGWTDEGKWDSRTGQFLYFGFRQARKFIAYSEEKNEWRVIPKQFKWPLKNAMGHIYSNNAYDPVKSIFYHHPAKSSAVYGYDMARDEWKRLPDLPARGRMGTSLEYFPELGGLIRHAANTLHIYSEKNKSWSGLGKTAVCGYHSLARYNPYLKEMLLVGGDQTKTVVEKLDSKGKLTRLKDSPVSLAIRFDKLVVDPVTKCYLVFSQNMRFLHEFDSTANTWKEVAGYKRPADFHKHEMPILASVPEYGVIAVMGKKTRLYKYKESDKGK